MTEAHVQQQVRLALSRAGVVLFRNNVGAYTDDRGRLVRYGVCHPGGADLIGWQPVTVTQEMVGSTVAVFCAVEVKGPRGRPTEAQENFIRAVRDAGGRAGIARSADDALQIMKR